jgi:uncharacterized protein (TIGR03437 family)
LSILSRFVCLSALALALLPAQSLRMTVGNGQIMFEQFQSQPFTVQALDASGKPVSGATVSFTLTLGPGRVQIPTAVTDANGLASTRVVSSSLQLLQSFESQTLHAASAQGSVDFRFTTISSLGQGGPAQPGTFLIAPASDTGELVITGASGSTLPGAIQIAFSAATGDEQGQPIPYIGVNIVPFDTFTTVPAMCDAPAGVTLSNAKGIASCDLTITAAPGTYEFQTGIGDLLTYRVFTLIVTAPLACTYSLSASSQTAAAGPANGSVNVLTAADCFWTATSNVPWITISSGAQQTGNGTVGFSVAANTTAAARTGTLSIAGQTFLVTQSASSTTPTGLSIATGGTLPPATLNTAYATTLAATGGTTPYAWTSAGTLPPGVAISSSGVIAGTPTASGVYGFTATVTDATNATSSQAFTLAVNSTGTQTFAILNVSFANGVVGQSYSQEVKTAGGCTSPFHPGASIASTGALPPGLGLQFSGNQTFIAGTPTTTGSYNFSLSATDACAVKITSAFTIVVGTSAPPPAQFNATPSSLAFTYVLGGVQPSNQSFTLDSGVTSAAYTASVTAGGSWLVIVSGASGSTPVPVTVGLTGFSALAPGVYTGAVTITAVNGGTPLQIPVTLTVSAGAMLTATPAALVFNLTTSGSKSSAQQTVAVASAGASVHFASASSTTTGTGWLSVTPPGGDTPASLTVTANASGLVAGSYTGSVAIVPSVGAVVSLPVTLSVTGAPTFAVSPGSLSFNVQSGLTPSPQAVSLTSGPPIGFTVLITPASAASWLSVNTFTALTPATLNVSVNPAALTPGTYNATVTISDPSNTSLPVTIPVSVDVAPRPVVSAVTNGASFAPGAVAPGELLVLFGSSLGPATLVSTGLPLGNSLSGTSVLFDGSPGIMLYTLAQQVAVIAPVGIAGRASTQVQVEYQGTISPALDVLVVDSSPGVFMTDKAGQGAIVNPDGSANSAAAPAASGSVILIFATGGGQTDPPTVDGIPSAGAAPLLLPVSVQIDGLPAAVQYKGAAPGLVGLDQFNVVVPPGVRTGVPVPVLLTVGTVTSPAVTMYVMP